MKLFTIAMLTSALLAGGIQAQTPVAPEKPEPLPPDPFIINVPIGNTTLNGTMIIQGAATRIDDKKVSFRGKDGKTAESLWDRLTFDMKGKLNVEHERVVALMKADPLAATRKYADYGLPTTSGTAPTGINKGAFGKKDIRPWKNR